MGKSIRTTSNTQTPINSTPATFKAGDSVLCPFFGNGSYPLFIDDEHGLLSFIAGVNKYHTQADGKLSLNDKSPSIFHDTPANRQAISTLYDQAALTPSQRQAIDATEVEDEEVILISAFDLSDIACDINGAITVLSDIGHLLRLIYQKQITHSQSPSMARLANDAVNTWINLLTSRLESIKEPLAKSAFGNEVAL